MSTNFISFNDFQNKINNKQPIEKQVKKEVVNVEPAKVEEAKQVEPNAIQAQPTQAPQAPLEPMKNETPSAPAPAVMINQNAQDSFEKASAKFDAAKKQNGLVEKIADKIKGLVGIGYSSKKIEESLNKINTGEKTQEEVEKEISAYRSSQENVAQATGDILSILAAGAVFFNIKKGISLPKAVAKLNGKKADYASKAIANANFQKYMPVMAATFASTFTKSISLMINRIGTKQYKPEVNKETMSKEEIRNIKKDAKKEKANANFRNSASGAINGLTMGIMSALGPIGAPIYVAINAANRYFIGTKEDADSKDFGSFIENLKSSKIVHIATAITTAIPLIKKSNHQKVLEKNINKVVENLSKVEFYEVEKTQTAYQELEGILLHDSKISDIINDLSMSNEEKITALSKENIFAVKFLQIQQTAESKMEQFIEALEGSFGSRKEKIALTLKENCPETWTTSEAQAEIDRLFGKGKYVLDKCVGSGTVAQTYNAKTADGKEVCVKLLHKGISADKITADRDAFIEIIKKSDRTQAEKDFLIENIKNIAKTVQDEADLEKEMASAQQMAKVVKQAKVVTPIEAKKSAYVMERAEGISLATLRKFTYYAKDFKGKGIIYDKFDKVALEAAYKNYQDSREIERTVYSMYNSSPKEIVEALKKKGITSVVESDIIKSADYDWIDTNGTVEKIAKKLKVEEGKAQLDKAMKMAYGEDSYRASSYYYGEFIKSVQDYAKYQKIMQENPGIETLDSASATTMMAKYNDIINEQFSKVDANGKVIHGDIHDGNIFINVKALKEGKKDFFTLIDTGNTIDQTPEQAIRFMNLTQYCQNADVDNIAKFVLKGAKLPEGMDEAKAYELVCTDLKAAFFDNETSLDIVNNDTILSLTDTIMKKHKIIPSSTQGALAKAKQSADNSARQLSSIFIDEFFKHFEEGSDGIKSAGGDVAKLATSGVANKIKKRNIERANLLRMPLKERARIRKGIGTPKDNSVEAITYRLKQEIVKSPRTDWNNPRDVAKWFLSKTNGDTELMVVDFTNQKDLDYIKKQGIDVDNKELIEKLIKAQKQLKGEK